MARTKNERPSFPTHKQGRNGEKKKFSPLKTQLLGFLLGSYSSEKFIKKLRVSSVREFSGKEGEDL